MAEYTAPSDFPVQNPVLTQVLAELVTAESLAEGPRPRAFDSIVRYSDAGRCARAIAFDRICPEAGEAPDVASEFRMWVGTVLHEHVQNAIVQRYGGRIEVPTYLGGTDERPLMSGHCDWVGVIDGTELGRVLMELKTEGSYGFDKAIGIDRKGYQRKHPHGPRSSAKIQGALNAVANDCDTLVIGVIAMDAISIQLAERTGLTTLDRICAEWHYPRSEFSQWAADEIERAMMIDQCIADGILPPREAIGDEMEVVKLNPESDRPAWNCVYCRQRDACLKCGPGPALGFIIPLKESV